MKKSILTAVLLVFGFAASFAQFEKGKIRIGAEFDGAGISYSKETKLNIGAGANIGYMFRKDWMLIANAGFDYSNKELQDFHFGSGIRYFIEQNGLFLQGGLKYVHAGGDYNNIALTPEVGYCFFLNGNLTVEPSLYYDMSLSDFGDKSRFGVKVGLGWYF